MNARTGAADYPTTLSLFVRVCVCVCVRSYAKVMIRLAAHLHIKRTIAPNSQGPSVMRALE